MSGLNRRDFLKALGLSGGTAAVAGCGLDDNRYYTPFEQVLPYVVRPELVTPGTPTFFATTVLSGPRARTALARHRDGRVINVGANKRSPIAPAVLPAELFELQKHYSPDRFQGPSEGGNPVQWDAALQKLTDAVKSAKSSGKKVAWLGGYRTGALVNLINDFADEAVYWEPMGYECEALATEALFGQRSLPRYDLSRSTVVLSFGADFLNGWGDPDLADQWAQSRNQGSEVVSRTVMVSPRRGHTGANADDWYSVTPGTEAGVALALAKAVAAKTNRAGLVSAWLGDVDIDANIGAAGMTREVFDTLTKQLHSDAVVLPGGVSASGSAGVALAKATYLLNLAIGADGSRFGLGGYAGPIDTFGRVQKLVEDMAAGSIGVLLLDDVNPAFALPASVGFEAAIAKVGLVVGLSSHPDESNAAMGLSLPTSDVFEDWGHEEPFEGLHLLRQPTMTPLYDTVSVGDILLSVARAAGLTAAVAATETAELQGGSDGAPAPAPAFGALGFEPKTWLDYLKAWWESHLFPHDTGFDAWWAGCLGDGFFDTNTHHGATRRGLLKPAPAPVDAPVGEYEGDGDFALHVFRHPYLDDGRYANQPWAQETSDPLSGIVWDTWLEVSPGDAERLGVNYNDQVEVSSANGTVRIGVQVSKWIADGTVGISSGNGHKSGGRYADGYGVNVANLLGARSSADGTFCWQQARVSVKRTSGEGGLVTTFSQYGDSDENRGFAVSVNAASFAAQGDERTDHPGDLTGIHHLPRDPRLKEIGRLDFYEMPEHPIYRFGMTVDTDTCTGCGACIVACYAENNLPVVGKVKVEEGREMAWMRIDRFVKEREGGEEYHFVPMMCQQCGHAGCESVCPVLATYHTIEGLNAMVYNRCVGTRYCSNACPYTVRRFNYHSYRWPEPFNLQLNPDVSVRTMGVMEKCTFCVQRIRDVKSAYRDRDFTAVVPDGELAQLTACAEACPSQALTFGNLNDPESGPSKTRHSGRNYYPLVELNAFPAVNYLAKVSFHVDAPSHGGGHGEGHEDGHGDAHGDAHEEESHQDGHDASHDGSDHEAHDAPEHGSAGEH